MACRRPRLCWWLASTALGLLAIKLFTASVGLVDDPTRLLVVHPWPSPHNELILDSLEGSKLVVLARDENGFVGQGLYEFVTRYLWWPPLLPLSACAWLRFRKRREPAQNTRG